jgi:hypothetical protein
MLRVTKETTSSPEEALEKAKQFFGPDGLGLEVKDECDTDARFEGGGGYVYVEVCGVKGGTEVTIEEREWDYQVKEFLRTL